MAKGVDSLRRKVENVVGRGPNPFSEIPGICERDRANDNTSIVVRLLRDVASTRNHNLVGRPNLRTDELSLIANEESKVLHVLSLLPPPRNDVPLRRGANNDISLLEQTKICTGLSSQANNFFASLNSSKLRLPLCQTEVNHILIRFDTNRALVLRLTPQSHQRKFCTNSLSAASGGTDEDIVIGSIQRLEDLRLDLVKRLDGGRVDSFEFCVMKGGNREMLKVEESGRWRELLGEDEMLERNRDAGLRVQPSVGDDGNEIIGRNRFEHWNSDCDVVFHLGVLLSKNECIAEEDNLSIDILNENIERFGTPVNFLVPTEVRYNGDVNAKEGACDGLDRGLQPEQGSL